MQNSRFAARFTSSFKRPFLPKQWLKFLWNDAIRIRIWEPLQRTQFLSMEPRVTRKRDARGHDRWEIYDPRSRQTISCGSEREVRAWLESRYYAS